LHALLIPSYRSIDGFGLVDQAALVPVPNLVPETGWFAGAGLGGALLVRYMILVTLIGLALGFEGR